MAVTDAPAGAIGLVEIAVAVTGGTALAGLDGHAGPLFDALRLAPPPSATGLVSRPLGRLHLGNEFCERLIPSPTLLKRAIGLADAAGLALTLATPTVPDAGLAKLRRLFRILPEGAEVVANDYGVLRLLAREFPALEPVAGRQLCKMIKDPRLPNEKWARLNPPGLGSPEFEDILGRFGVRRAELDVPPFARPADLRAGGLALSVHAPFGYALRGRVCRIGSLRFEGAAKFRPDQACAKECLGYACRLTRPADHGQHDLESFQRGNSIFYRHDTGMGEAMWRAVENGWIDRIVLAGDWREPCFGETEGDRHADHGPH
ncbi:MAG: hypothetical protein IMF08_15775 [Proteobacteria bacterium]|nr:hypothetical protein [Pseudomonadota bacterium]